jgi:hypothetical protein
MHWTLMGEENAVSANTLRRAIKYNPWVTVARPTVALSIGLWSRGKSRLHFTAN